MSLINVAIRRQMRSRRPPPSSFLPSHNRLANRERLTSHMLPPRTRVPLFRTTRRVLSRVFLDCPRVCIGHLWTRCVCEFALATCGLAVVYEYVECSWTANKTELHRFPPYMIEFTNLVIVTYTYIYDIWFFLFRLQP